MKKYFKGMLIGLIGLSSVINVVADEIDFMPLVFDVLLASPGDDDDSGHSLPRTPVTAPVVAQDGHTLYLYSGCDDTTLSLVDEDDEELYSTNIAEGTTQLVLPSSIEGTYELRIQRGQYVFYTEIEL